MPEEIIFRRRNRIKNDVVITSKVLLYGYAYVSDAAKITYQVIDGFDWEDKATKASKGCAWPASETLANIRKTTVRTGRIYGLGEGVEGRKKESKRPLTQANRK